MATMVQEEYFELCLGTEGHRISTENLIDYLNNITKLFISINEIINNKYSCGFDQIEFDVIALKEGSFKIPLCIKKITRNPAFAAIVGSLCTYILSLLNSENETRTTSRYINSIELTNEELFENENISKAISNIAKITVESPRIKDLTIICEKDNGEKEKVTISKETLSQFVYYKSEEKNNFITIKNATLEIVSPVFTGGPAVWKVNYDGKLIEVQMNDLDFLEKVKSEKLSFAPGDVITADLGILTTTTEGYLQRKFYISSVKKYPKFSRISRMNPLC